MAEDIVSSVGFFARRLRESVPRGIHMREGIEYRDSFTGSDIISTLQMVLRQRFPTSSQEIAHNIAQSLYSQFFFCEVARDRQLRHHRIFRASEGEVYMFASDFTGRRLPTGVMAGLTSCYAPTCEREEPCYAPDCPKRGQP
ncbi:hypothetical protein PM082_006605 [Marasmius tenuissimus]|nr:hypothetical protein PM082_006605 [Marasmius tenuissimus]